MRMAHLCASALVSFSLVAITPANATNDSEEERVATGFVFEDYNHNGLRDKGEPGVPGVSVSNGLDVVQTNKRGRYRLKVTDETVIFITKPSGYDVPVDEVQLPQFYYVHYPNGTPPVANWLFDVIEPTGTLPKRVNFPLYRSKQDESAFRALAFADPQSGNFGDFLSGVPDEDGQRMLTNLRDEFIEGLVGTNASFVMVAGDIINDVLSLYPRHNRIMATLGIPVWNAPGNHDMNFKSPNDKYSTQTYIRNFGPPNYSFDYGDVHFIAMDNVEFAGNSEPFAEGIGSVNRFSSGLPEGGSNVKGFFSEEQLEWLKNDLRYVPKSKLVVLYTHISLKTLAISGGNTIGAANINTQNLDELLAVLNSHPNVYTFSGHDTSNLWTLWLGEEEGRAPGLPAITHKKIAEVRTSLRGPNDDRGVAISHTDDGNPNGYYFFDFDGADIETRFEAGYARINTPSKSRKELDDFQMRISVGVNVNRDAIHDLSVDCPTPDAADSIGPRNYVVVNVFDSNAEHKVKMSLDGGAYVPMEQMIRPFDVATLPDGVDRPAGTAWCKDPFRVRYRTRSNGFLGLIQANLKAEGELVDGDTLLTEISRQTLGGSDPSSTLWYATIPQDLDPGAHVIRVKRVDEHGNRAKGHEVFEVCDPLANDGQIEGRDCYVLGPR